MREAKSTCKSGLVWDKMWFKGDLTSKKLGTLIDSELLIYCYKLITYSITYGPVSLRCCSPLGTSVKLVTPFICVQVFRVHSSSDADADTSLSSVYTTHSHWLCCCCLCTYLCRPRCPLCSSSWSDWTRLCLHSMLLVITCCWWSVVLTLISTCHQP
jgi:hypothetical protein